MKYMLSMTAVFLWGLVSGCNSETAIDKKSPPPLAQAEDSTRSAKTTGTDKGVQVSDTPTVVDIEGIKFTIPAGWKRVDLMPAQAGIIAARYLIPADDAELQLTFTSARGGIEANFERWKNQFELEAGVDPLEDRIALSDGEAFWIDLRGTFKATGGSFSGEGPKPDSRMIGVGIPFGGEEMYLKLVGKADDVAKMTDDLKQLVKSADLP